MCTAALHDRPAAGTSSSASTEVQPVRLEGTEGPLACTPANVLKAFKAGNVCVMTAKDILPPEILRLSLPVLREEHGDARLVRTMAQFLSPTSPMSANRGKSLDELPPDARRCCESPNPTFREFIDDVMQEAEWKPDGTYRGLARGSGCKGLLSACYGVANVKQLRGLERVASKFFTPLWYHVFNFVWVGWSPGGLHYDEMDNVLVQVAGTKSIVIFPPHVTDLIDGEHYPGSGKGRYGRPPFNGKEFFSEESLRSQPLLAAVPHYHVRLKPGDAVSIPRCGLGPRHLLPLPPLLPLLPLRSLLPPPARGSFTI